MDRHEGQSEPVRQPRFESKERSKERSLLIAVSRRLLNYDTSPLERDQHVREKDRGSANSSAIRATDDVLSCCSARSGGRGFVFQQLLRQPQRRDILLILLAAIVIVTTAFATACSGSTDAPPTADDDRPTQSSDGRQPGSLNVSPVAGRLQPTAEEWNAILPLLEQAAAAPQDKSAQRQLALAYYNLGRFQKAVTIYERLLASEEDAVLRNRLGNTLRDMGNTDGADKAYRKAIADDPTLAPPYLNLAELLWRQARDAEALTVLDQGLQAVPKKAQPPLQTARDFIKNER